MVSPSCIVLAVTRHTGTKPIVCESCIVLAGSPTRRRFTLPLPSPWGPGSLGCSPGESIDLKTFFYVCSSTLAKNEKTAVLVSRRRHLPGTGHSSVARGKVGQKLSYFLIFFGSRLCSNTVEVVPNLPSNTIEGHKKCIEVLWKVYAAAESINFNRKSIEIPWNY